MATAAVEPKDPKFDAFVITVKDLVLQDPFPEHPEAEFIHVRQPFHNEDVYKHLAETLGTGRTAQRGSDKGLKWVSKGLEDRTTTKSLLVGYVFQGKTQCGYPGISPQDCSRLRPSDGLICCFTPDFSKFLYVVSPISPDYRTSSIIEPLNIHLYAIVVESGIGRPFRVRHDHVFFLHEFRTHGIPMQERRPRAWLRNVGKVCKDLATVKPTDDPDAPVHPTQNVSGLIGPASISDDESKYLVHCLDEPVELGSSNDHSESRASNCSWGPDYHNKCSEESEGSSTSSECMEQAREDESMGTVLKAANDNHHVLAQSLLYL